jgi:hypothetical protein
MRYLLDNPKHEGKVQYGHDDLFVDKFRKVQLSCLVHILMSTYNSLLYRVKQTFVDDDMQVICELICA